MSKQGVFLRTAEGSDTATIEIVGVIGWEVAFENLRAMFAALPASIARVVFDIYSPGGDVWAGNGIVNAIGELGKTRETHAKVQVAASMATLIAVACKTRSMASNGRWLVHNPWSSVQGDAAEMERTAEMLRATQQEAAEFYAFRTGKTTDEMLALMAEERWLMPDEAEALGFVHSIDNPFAPEDRADVRAEITAAGRWPMALADISTKEDGDGNADTEGAKKTQGGETGEPDNSADGGTAVDAANAAAALIAAESAGYDYGLADGRALAASEAERSYSQQAAALKSANQKLEALVRSAQSEKDKALAQMAAAEKATEERIAALRGELEAARTQLRKFTSGALSFSPAIETWEEALKACGGDHVKAAKAHPDLQKRYIETHKQNAKK